MEKVGCSARARLWLSATSILTRVFFDRSQWHRNSVLELEIELGRRSFNFKFRLRLREVRNILSLTIKHWNCLSIKLSIEYDISYDILYFFFHIYYKLLLFSYIINTKISIINICFFLLDLITYNFVILIVEYLVSSS